MHELQVVDAAELAAAYAAATYGVVIDGDGLPLRVGERATDVEACWPARRYLFITAWNPASRPHSEAANLAAGAVLLRQIDAAATPRQPAWAQAPDGQWREPGWLLADTSADEGLRLAQAFGQAGVLMWERGDCVRLRMLAPRPRHVASTHIDWID